MGIWCRILKLAINCETAFEAPIGGETEVILHGTG